MKRYAISALAVFISMIALAVGSSVCDYAPCEPAINATVGKEFNITVPSNPSTGFDWWTDFDPQFLSLVGIGSVRENASLKMVGVPEKEVFTFQALLPGETEVYLILLQPWENGTIAEKLIYPVEVAE